MKVILNPKFNHISDFINALPESFDQTGVRIYVGRNQVKCFETNGIKVVVKRFRKPIFINQIVYTFFRSTKARRAYINGLEVLKRGFQTPLPIAYIEIKKTGFFCDSFFVSLYSDFPRNMQEFADDNITGKEDIIEAFAQFTCNLHKSGLYPIDYSTGNIFFDRIEGKWEFLILDINRMNFGPVSFKEGCKSFIRLWGGENFFTLLYQQYAKFSGYDFEKTKLVATKQRDQFNKRTEQKQILKNLFKVKSI